MPGKSGVAAVLAVCVVRADFLLVDGCRERDVPLTADGRRAYSITNQAARCVSPDCSAWR